ncbi:MAG: fasciclin domain-containing protein [Rubricoccaceae bacterium]
MRFLLLFLLVLSACAPDPEPNTPTPEPDTPSAATDDSVVGIVGTSSQLSTLASALESTGLAETLRDTESAYTLFAPDDAAFEAIPEAERTALLADTERLTALLSGHVLPTRMLSPDIIDGLTIEAMNGTELTLQSDGTTVQLMTASGTRAAVITPDLDTSNGVVHIIDAVLSP